MALRDRINNYIRGVKGVTTYPRHILATAEQEKYNIPSLSLPQRQAELYQRLSWVAIAVGHVANEAAGTPLEVLQDMGDDTEGIVNHEFEQLLKRPNPTQSRFELLEHTFLWRLLTGNAYWWMNKANENAAPTEIWTIPSYKIEPVPDGNMYIKGYLYDPGNGKKILLEPWEVVQFKRFNPFNPYVGMSAIEALATVAIGDMKMQEWNTNFFGKDNAKMPGILSFADPITDSDWQKLQDDLKAQQGGTKRNLMMLRNAGAGGVNWVATAMSQKDMEFLSARRFTQYEIYDMLAPGLAQWLAPDTTNANAASGRDALMELAIWPLHQSTAETISNKIMPLYGENLIAEFEDVRPKDRAMVLQEQQAFSQVHVLDEIRAEFYKAKPIGDERGGLLLAELTGNSFQKDVGNLPGKDIIDEEAENRDANKAKEREQFRKFASKRIEQGKAEKIGAFTFDYLSGEEQAAIKAEFAQPTDDFTTLIDALGEAIKALREVPDDDSNI